jgi:hypothetical protein
MLLDLVHTFAPEVNELIDLYWRVLSKNIFCTRTNYTGIINRLRITEGNVHAVVLLKGSEVSLLLHQI